MVAVCHQPGTPAAATRSVPEAALKGHLAHGDTLLPGECPPDIIFFNGHVVTMEAALPQAEALATLGEHILAIGSNEVSLIRSRGRFSYAT